MIYILTKLYIKKHCLEHITACIRSSLNKMPTSTVLYVTSNVEYILYYIMIIKIYNIYRALYI